MREEDNACTPSGWERFEYFIAQLHAPLKSVSAVATFLIMMIAVIDVVGRTFFQFPLLGSMELTEVAMAVLVFPMFPYIMLRDSHLNVEMIYRRTSDGTQALLSVFCWSLSLVYTALLAWQLSIIALEKMHIRENTFSYDLPLWVFIGLGAVCLGLFTLAILVHAVVAFRQALCNGRQVMALMAVLAGLGVALAPLIFSSSLMTVNKGVLGGLGMCYLFLLILMGMPIGMSMMIAGFQGIFLIMPSRAIAFAMVGTAPYTALTAIHLSVIPMFLLMGELALIGGVSTELFRTANAWLGRLPGGLAVASVAGCAGFAAVCGESIPTAMTMAAVSLPEMRKKGYNPAFAAACLSLGGTLGILIPPSMGFIIYSIIVEESVGKLFMAGIVPGILLVTVICGIIVIRAIRDPELAPRGDYVPWSVKIRSLVGLLPMLLLFGVIIGGILSGLCSPTEGGAVGSMTALLYAVLHGRVSFAQLRKSFEDSAVLTGKIFLILMGVTILGYFLAATRLPFAMADLIISLNAGKWAVLFGTILLFIILGCLMNVIPMIMLTLPALFPTLTAMGFDPIWFGVICVLLMELGQITPPIGVLVFALSTAVPDVPVEDIYKEVAPFFLGIFITIGLIIVFPSIALWLPNLLFSGV